MAEFSLKEMGERLKQIRTERGFGEEGQLRAFCRKYHRNPTVWGQLEKGEKKTLYLQSIVELAEQFDISPTWLLFRIGKPQLSAIGKTEDARWERTLNRLAEEFNDIPHLPTRRRLMAIIREEEARHERMSRGAPGDVEKAPARKPKAS